MQQLPLSSDDILSCIELASDGVNLHLENQDKLDLIHRIMYAIAESAHSNQTLSAQLGSNQSAQYLIYLQNVRPK